MSIVIYPSLITQADGGALHARFVDFTDLVVSEAMAADLLASARRALSARLQALIVAGEAWPEPTAIGTIETAPGSSLLLVDVSVDDPPVRVTVSLGERLLKRIDRDAEARSMTRSGYLALGARGLLGERVEPQEDAAQGTGRLQEELAALGRRVNETLGPESPVGRTLAELDAMALEGLRRLGGEVTSAMRNSRARRSEQAQDHEEDGRRFR